MTRCATRRGLRRLASVGAVAAVTALLVAGCGGSVDGGGAPSGSAVSFNGDLSGTQPAGTVIATSGFDVAKNGFNFENYGNEGDPLNLDAAAMASLFGDQVCSRTTKDGECKLTPTAKKWMKSMNDSMGGGHCFGLAGLSWAMFKGQIDADAYGASQASELEFDGNQDLQADIAAVFATQATAPTSADMRTYAPRDVLSALAAAWQNGDGFALGFANLRDGEQVDGHAVTPVALESMGDGKVAIVLYDNNYPEQPQRMVVDPQANTWTYSTSSNPADDPQAYTGDADNPLELWPVVPMLGPQDCPFCSDGSSAQASGLGGAKRSVSGGSAFNLVYLNQESDAKGVAITVTDLAGQPIPGAQARSPLSAGQTAPPAVSVPKDVVFKVRIDGSALTQPAQTDLSIIGPGYSYAVDQVTIDPGVADTVVFDPASNALEYQTSTGAAPDLTLTLDGDKASYSFLFGGLDLPAQGGSIKVRLDEAAQTVTASAAGGDTSEIDFVIERDDEDSEEVFESEPIPLAPGEALIVEYGKWGGSGTSMPVGIDTDGSGRITEQLVDAK